MSDIDDQPRLSTTRRMFMQGVCAGWCGPSHRRPEHYGYMCEGFFLCLWRSTLCAKACCRTPRQQRELAVRTIVLHRRCDFFRPSTRMSTVGTLRVSHHRWDCLFGLSAEEPGRACRTSHLNRRPTYVCVTRSRMPAINVLTVLNHCGLACWRLEQPATTCRDTHLDARRGTGPPSGALAAHAAFTSALTRTQSLQLDVV